MYEACTEQGGVRVCKPTGFVIKSPSWISFDEGDPGSGITYTLQYYDKPPQYDKQSHESPGVYIKPEPSSNNWKVTQFDNGTCKAVRTDDGIQTNHVMDCRLNDKYFTAESHDTILQFSFLQPIGTYP